MLRSRAEQRSDFMGLTLAKLQALGEGGIKAMAKQTLERHQPR